MQSFKSHDMQANLMACFAHGYPGTLHGMLCPYHIRTLSGKVETATLLYRSEFPLNLGDLGQAVVCSCSVNVFSSQASLEIQVQLQARASRIGGE